MSELYIYQNARCNNKKKQLRKLWFMKPVVSSTGTPQRMRCKKKQQHFLIEPNFFIAGMKVHWEDGGGSILLGDNTGWAVTLRPIRFQFVKILDSPVCTLTVDHTYTRGPVISVGIATGYGLDGPGIEFRWGRDFPHMFQTGSGAQPTPCAMGTGSFPGVKSGRAVTLTLHPLLVPWSWKGRATNIQLYLYSPYGP